jgi:flagellar hook-basal body complex protein FliE
MTTSAIAANTYAALARIADPAGGIASAADKDKTGPAFGALLKDALGTVLQTGQKSDAQMQAVAAGKANIVDVVTAVAETEVAIDTLVSVRDRVISAYEEIMKMPI